MQTGLFDAPGFEPLPLADAQVALWRNWLSESRAQQLFDRLTSTLNWEQPSIIIAGRPMLSPRLQSWHGDSAAHYAYSGSSFQPQVWTPELTELREQIAAACNARFNSVLVNWYRHGDDSVSWHADNEPELGRNPVIASLSLGASRRFLLRHNRRERGARSHSVTLSSGDLLLMAGPTQHHWQHCVPKTREPTGGRVNLTFRFIYPA